MVHSPTEGRDPVDDGRLWTAEQARDMTRGFLLVAAPEGGSGAESVLLVVSELVTNALRHANGVTELTLEAGLGAVTVAVHDASTAPPQPVPWDTGEPGGFGWPLVQDLSDDVQVHVHTAGKAVMAIVPCPTAVLAQG